MVKCWVSVSAYVHKPETLNNTHEYFTTYSIVVGAAVHMVQLQQPRNLKYDAFAFLLFCVTVFFAWRYLQREGFAVDAVGG